MRAVANRTKLSPAFLSIYRINISDIFFLIPWNEVKQPGKFREKKNEYLSVTLIENMTAAAASITTAATTSTTTAITTG